MIGDLFFLLRMVVYTVSVTLVLQLNIGSQSIERHLSGWIYDTGIDGFFQQAADGAIALTSSLSKRIPANTKDRVIPVDFQESLAEMKKNIEIKKDDYIEQLRAVNEDSMEDEEVEI